MYCIERKFSMFLMTFPKSKWIGGNGEGGWTWIPCSTWENPGRMCRQTWRYPCWKAFRRTTRYSFVLEYRFPANLVENLQEQIKKCHEKALQVAKDIIERGVLTGAFGAVFAGNPLQAPAAALQGGIRSITVAIKWYLELLAQCVEGVFEGLGQQVKRRRPTIRPVGTSTPWR